MHEPIQYLDSIRLSYFVLVSASSECIGCKNQCIFASFTEESIFFAAMVPKWWWVRSAIQDAIVPSISVMSDHLAVFLKIHYFPENLTSFFLLNGICENKRNPPFFYTLLKKKPQLTGAKSDDSSLTFTYIQKYIYILMWKSNGLDGVRIQSLTTLIPKTHIIPHSYRSNKSRHE